MAYTTAQLLGALLTVDGRATEGGIIDIPPGARLLLDVTSSGQESGDLLDDIFTAAEEAKNARDAAVAITGIASTDDAISALVNSLSSDTRAALATAFSSKATQTTVETGRLSASSLAAAYVARPTQHTFLSDYQGGGVSDTTALTNAIAASAGKTLHLEGQSLSLADVIESTADGVTIDARGATLNFLDDGSAEGRIFRAKDCEDFAWLGGKITQTAAARTGFYGMMTLWNVTRARVDGLTVVGGSSTGIFTALATDLHITNATIRNTKADGIHLSRQTTNTVIDSPIVVGAQDDAIGIISTASEGVSTFSPCRFIQIKNPTIRDLVTLGSGIALNGARDISISGGTIDNVPAAGLIIQNATEGATVASARIVATGVNISRAHGGTTGGVRVAGADLVTLNGLQVSACDSGAAVIVGSSRTTINGGHWVDSLGGFGIYDDAGSSYTLATGANLRGNPAGAHQLNGTGSAQSGNLV